VFLIGVAIVSLLALLPSIFITHLSIFGELLAAGAPLLFS
jgi:hypothetical protein